MSKEAVLIHGWNPDVYTNNLHGPVDPEVAWSHRKQLVNLLEREYRLLFYNLPGFCGNREPKTSYDIEDFSDDFNKWLKKQDKQPGLIIGYSFGGVVALDYKVRFRSEIPIVLIAPALLRQGSFRSNIAEFVGKIPGIKGNERVKALYQRTFSRYYRRGSPFIRGSYDKIARRDSTNLLEHVDPNEILLIYGDKDTSTPWNLVKRVIKTNDLNYAIIRGGGHNIGGTHPNEVVKQIKKFERG